MTNVRARIESGDREIVFARRNGGAWHVLQPEGKRAECSVNFDPRWGRFTEEDIQCSTLAFGKDKRCTRRGCKEMFDYAYELLGWEKND